MEIGIFSALSIRQGQTEQDAFKEWLEIADVCDEVGIDCFWLADFHFRPMSPTSSPLIGCAAIASRTKRLKVGTAVSLTPLQNPVRLAEEVASIDQLTGGRFIFGIGRSSLLDAYRGYNVDWAESRERFFESLEIMRLSWGDSSFSYEGQFHQFKDVNVVPKPLTKPHPEIRVACESRSTFEMMGPLGYPIMIRHQIDAAELAELIRQYDTTRRSAGFTDDLSVTMNIPVYVADTMAEARADTKPAIDEALAREAVSVAHAELAIADKEAEERLRVNRPKTYDEMIQMEDLRSNQPHLFGSPEYVVNVLQSYREKLGVTGICMTINAAALPHEKILRSLRLVGEKVRPYV